MIIAAESAVGIKEGGRTGLVAVTVATCFGLSVFLAPFLQSIPQVGEVGATFGTCVGSLVQQFEVVSVLNRGASSIPWLCCEVVLSTGTWSACQGSHVASGSS